MSLRLNGSNSGFSEITAPATAGDNTLTLPAGNGSANQFLKNSGTAGTLEFSSSATDSSGRLLINTSSSIPSPGIFNPALQVVHVSANADTCGISLSKFQASNASASPFIFQKSRSDTIGSHTIVNNNDVLGVVQFTGSDGSTFVPAAAIEGEVDGGPGSTDMPGRLVFSTTANGASTPTERMRLTNDGKLAFACTFRPSSGNTGGIFFDNDIITIGSTTSSAQDRMRFETPSGRVGAIQTDGNSTTYSTSSDYRLKENVALISDGLTRLKQLKPSRFNFIADKAKTVDGFLAHEAQTVVPEAITGTHNGVEVWKEDEKLPDGVSVGDNKLDEDGNTIPDYQGIDQSKLVPLLTAALQEAIGKIETLETQHADLLARVTALEAA